MKVNINPFDGSNPMSLKDAAVVALVVAAVTVCVGFLDPWTYEAVAAEPGRFCFELIKTAIKTFAASFISLAGLTEYMKRSEKESATPG